MATLKVTIKEEIVLNGKDMGNENFLSISGVTSAEHRIVTLPQDSEQSVLLFDASNVSAGTIKDDTLRHLRFTNLDASNNIQLRFAEADRQYAVLLEPGESYILGNDDMYGESTTVTDNPNLDNATTINSGRVNIDSINAMAIGADCELEMFIATT